MSVSATVTGENINLNSTDVITLLAGSSINVATSQIKINNSKISGLIDLDNLALTGTSKMQLQTDVFNNQQENLINSVNSQSRADQYGAVYGPTYGDNLGIFNGLGAFNGSDVGGYVGKTYSEVLNIDTYSKLQMYPLANNPFKETNAQIPMNLYANTISLSDFTTYSYNLSSSTNGAIVYDSFFGNLFPLTANGKDGSKNIYNRIDGNLNLRFSLVNGNIVANGNLYMANINTGFNIINGNAKNVAGNPQVLFDSNAIVLSANIEGQPTMIFNTSLNRKGFSISGITSVFNGNVYSNLNLSGTVLDGNFYVGNIQCLYNKFDYFANNFYRYAWHGNSNLKYLPQLEFPTGNVSNPFGNLTGNNILIAGELTPYSGGTYLPTVPLFPNQIAMFYYYYTPNPFTKLPFDISFKYQLYSQLRGDYFYFQYSIDGAKTWNNLLVQSGDIQSVKSQAIYNPSQWKPTSFFMPYSQSYIFRWVYKKSLNQENGYDTVVIADLNISNLEKIVNIDTTNPFNTTTITYSDKYLGNIVAGTVPDSLLKDYNLKFYSSNFTNGEYVINGMTNMNSYDWKDQRNSSPFYGNMNNMCRISDIPLSAFTHPYTSFDRVWVTPGNLSYNTITNSSSQDILDRGWRLYSKNALSNGTIIPPKTYGQLLLNASPSFLDGSELALVSSKSNNTDSSGQDPYGLDSIGLRNFDGSYFVIGPLAADSNFGLLLSNYHYLKFKFFVSAEAWDNFGVATYDYNTGNDTDVTNAFIKLVSFAVGVEQLKARNGTWGQQQPSTLLNAFFNNYIAEPISTASTAIASLHINQLTNLADNDFVTNWNGYTQNNVAFTPRYYNTNGINYNPSSYVNFDEQYLIKQNINFNCGDNGGFTIMICFKPNSGVDKQTFLYCRDSSNNNIIQLYRNTIDPGYSTSMVLYVQNGGTAIITDIATEFIDENRYVIYTIRVDNKNKTYEMFNQDNFTTPRKKGTFTTAIVNRTGYIISYGQAGANTNYPSTFTPLPSYYRMGSSYIFDRPLTNAELNQMYAWMYMGNTKQTSFGLIDFDRIKYYPNYSPYLGLFNYLNFYIMLNWIDVSLAMEPVQEGYKRIYVLYYLKNNNNQSLNSDIVLVHDMKFSFYNQINTIVDTVGNYYTKDNNLFISNDGYLSKCIVAFENNIRPPAALGLSDERRVAGIQSFGYSENEFTGSYNWGLRGVYSYASGYLYNSPGGDIDLIKSVDRNVYVGDRQTWNISQIQRMILGRVNNPNSINGCVIVTTYNGAGFDQPGWYSLYCIGPLYAASVTQPSDRRIKKDIEDIDDGQSLGIIKQLKPKTYKYIDQSSRTDERVYGFISQEVESVLPYSTTIQTECIPNLYTDGKIFKNDDKYILKSKDKPLNLLTENVQNKIRIVGPKNVQTNNLSSLNGLPPPKLAENIPIDVELIRVIDDYTLEILPVEDNLQIADYFIYGQYVTDFCALDKLTLLPVAISALQEVIRIQEKADAKVQAAENKIQQLEQQIQAQQDTINRILIHLNM